MRILVLNYEFPPIGGGAAPVSYDMCKKWVELGHHVTVVTMGFRELPEYEEIDGIAIYRLKCIRAKANVCHPWEQLSYIISGMIFLQRHLKKVTYDICHTHFIVPTGVISLWLYKKYKIKYVITAHGSDVLGHNKSRFNTLYKIIKKPWGSIVSHAYAVIAPSNYLLKLMEKSHAANYYMIGNGIDSKIFKREAKTKTILIMSRLQETKNIQLIIKALAMVALEDWSVIILGDGPYKGELENEVRKYRLEEKIQFKGWIVNKSAEHLKYLESASIYISASKVENCPNSVLEAMASGCKILLSDIEPHRQLVDDEEIFFGIDDAEVLAGKIEQLLKQDVRNNHYNLSEYEWETVMNQYEKIAEKCCMGN